MSDYLILMYWDVRDFSQDLTFIYWKVKSNRLFKNIRRSCGMSVVGGFPCSQCWDFQVLQFSNWNVKATGYYQCMQVEWKHSLRCAWIQCYYVLSKANQGWMINWILQKKLVQLKWKRDINQICSYSLMIIELTNTKQKVQQRAWK